MPVKERFPTRSAWKATVDPGVPLEEQLTSPTLRPWQVAHIMRTSESTVYTSCKRFDAAMRANDMAAASREVPCILLGNSHFIPTRAFLDWLETSGQITLWKMLAHNEAGAA